METRMKPNKEEKTSGGNRINDRALMVAFGVRKAELDRLPDLPRALADLNAQLNREFTQFTFPQ